MSTLRSITDDILGGTWSRLRARFGVNPTPRRPAMDYHGAYNAVVTGLLDAHPREKAMSLAVGGEWEVFGVLLREVLIEAGLKTSDFLIDVGCGSGRLAHTLDIDRYLGIDIVPDLIAYAREVCKRPDWRFLLVDSIAIPEEAGRADMVCFFSVFTHLLHEDSYRYLLEAYRVLKPGGKVVLSFLEFKMPNHWNIFDSMVKDRLHETHHNQFMSRDAIEAWAEHSGFLIRAWYDGNVPFIQVPQPMTNEHGQTVAGVAALGQSVCVLQKPEVSAQP